MMPAEKKYIKLQSGGIGFCCVPRG